MAKKFYTTVPRYVGNEYINGSVENPLPVTFPPGVDPLGRKVRKKGIETSFVKRKQTIAVEAPKSREKFTTEVEIEVPVTREVETEEYILFTEAEQVARGLLVRDEKDPAPEGQKLKPHFAGGAQGITPAAHTRDKLPEGRASDSEPSK